MEIIKRSPTRKPMREYVARYKNTPNGYYAFLKNSAKQRKNDLKISRDEFVVWYSNQRKQCTYCGIPEEKIHLLKSINGYTSKKLGIDRIDSSLGYESGNICLCCINCNRIKSNIFSYEEMLAIGELIHKKWKKEDERI